jgi:hypothetical protein
MGSYLIDSLRDSVDRLDRPADSRGWLIPGWVKIRGENLEWGWIRDGQISPEQVFPGRTMLEDFVALATATPKRIARFAQKWGMLSICQHGWPCSHNSSSVPNGSRGCGPLTTTANDYWEPIGSWHRYSRQAAALLRVAGRLISNKRPGRPEDWSIILESNPRAILWTPNLVMDRIYLVEIVNEWLRMGNVRLALDWPTVKAKPLLRPLGSGLFGALAMQLALAVGGVDSIATCDGCGRDYKPHKRRPKSGQRKFCRRCRRDRVPQKRALSDYRSRQREQRGN